MTSITSSWRRALLVLAAAMFLGTSCQREIVLPDVTVPDGQIVFDSEGLDMSVETKATEVTSLSSFYVTAVTGSAGSEASVWNSVQFSQVPGSSPASYAGNKYWPASNSGYKFYGSNVALNFAAGGTYVNATNATDVVCAYLASPTYKAKNTLSFEHIFARIGNVVITQVPGYTISGISIYITPKTGGTYNLRTGSGQTNGTGWSSVTTGSATRIANAGGTNVNDLYVVPGNYDLTCSWTSTDAGGNTVTHTNKHKTLPITGGKVNTINVALGGDILMGIDVREFEPYAWEQELEPLTFEAIENGSILWKTSSSDGARTIEYSKNNGVTWTELVSTTSGAAIPVIAGDKVLIRGNNSAYFSEINSYTTAYNYFSGTSRYYVYGNITDLLLVGYRQRLERNAFRQLFYNDTYLVSHPTKKIYLPSTSLSSNCYYYMFYGCTGLTTAPNLPATTLASYCYYYMFYGCTGLTTAPNLPATTLASNCYQSMFYGCTGLTTAPNLPATTLADGCYYSMFYVCTGLTTAPNLPATTLASYCYEQMFYGCTGLTTAPNLPATTLASYCYENMFYGCTGLTTAPNLPATTLASNCYHSMFYGCTGLTTAPNLPATTLASYCYYSMFYGCTGLTTAPNLPATTLADGCYYSMFYGCTGLTTAPAKLPAKSLATSCYYQMFRGCTSLTTAPELPASNLVSSCYNYMFYNCSSLNYIKALFLTTPSSTYTSSWVYGVAATGTFVKANTATWTSTGTSAVPSGWTIQTTGPTLGKIGKFNDMEIAPCNLMFDGEKFIVPYDDWNHDSRNSIYGKTYGSYYFSFVELGSYFDSRGNSFNKNSGSINNNGEKVTYNGHNDWYIPTYYELTDIIEGFRVGSTVNGVTNVKFVYPSDFSGVLVFPDGLTMTGATIDRINSKSVFGGENVFTVDQINSYVAQGCVFLPQCGGYKSLYSSWDVSFYWCSDDESTTIWQGGQQVTAGRAYSVSNVMMALSDNKTSMYFPVRLVRFAD